MTISDPKNSVPQRGIESQPLTIHVSIITTRLPRTLITVTFTHPKILSSEIKTTEDTTYGTSEMTLFYYGWKDF